MIWREEKKNDCQNTSSFLNAIVLFFVELKNLRQEYSQETTNLESHYKVRTWSQSEKSATRIGNYKIKK